MKNTRTINYLKTKLSRILISDWETKRMRKRNAYATAVIIIILTTILVTSPAISSLISTVILPSSGTIATRDFDAISGKATDIQAAVNIASSRGGGTVHIPAGTWNFREANQSWQTVSIPAGVNITGADPILDSNGNVIQWTTILQLPASIGSTVGDPKRWFTMNYHAEPNQVITHIPMRFSNITLRGYQYYNPSSPQSSAASIGIYIQDCWNFRIDHCRFQDLCWNALQIGEVEGSGSGIYITRSACGVVDHNVLNNTIGDPDWIGYDDRTLDYGIMLRKWATGTNMWDFNLSNVWGHYTNYTVIIENNYFSKWRHGFCSNDGFHVVFRNNIVDKDYGGGSIDGHGSYADSEHPDAVGTRCVEVYNNTFQYPDNSLYAGSTTALNIRAGSWIVYNNTVNGYSRMMDLNSAQDWGNYAPYHTDYPFTTPNGGIPTATLCHMNSTYIWGNTLINTPSLIGYNPDSVQNTDYFLRAPSLAQDGISYTAYTYPSPLTYGSP
jgi:hypothetical protein